MASSSSPAQRIEALERLAHGELAIRDLVGLAEYDTGAMAYLGKVAFESGRFDQAVTIFEALHALEPENPDHAFCLAEAEVRRQNVDRAVVWITRYLDHDGVWSMRHRASALLFRASLTQGSDPASSGGDVRLAKRLAERFDNAAEVVEAVLR